jgi:deoxyribodipyrimidine photo-lyase
MDTALVWFRNNLRTQDNSSLTHAIASGKRVIGLYSFDPRQFQIGDFGFKKTEKYRAQFLIETVQNLKKNLNDLNITLIVTHEHPEITIPELIDQHNISEIYSQKEWTREENEVTLAVEKKLSNVKHHTYYDQFLFHPEDIPFDTFGDIPQVFTQFRKKCEKESSVHSLQEKIEALPSKNLLDEESDIPNLQELGLDTFTKDHRSAFPWNGGEDEAWNRLNNYFWNTKKLQYYKKTRNGLVGEDYSSKLSAWLANGSISARQIYWEVKKFEKEIISNQDTYWLIFELIWRDYFKYVSLKHGNDLFKIGGILHKNYDWKRNDKAQREWIHGNTTYDFVNANMIELKETGWMSNRGRQNVASFWAKEQQQDWRVGAAYFESVLIDYDVHSNWANWMYNAGVGNDPRDRKFNIKRQQEMYDGNGKFVRLWTQNELF